MPSSPSRRSSDQHPTGAHRGSDFEAVRVASRFTDRAYAFGLGSSRRVRAGALSPRPANGFVDREAIAGSAVRSLGLERR